MAYGLDKYLGMAYNYANSSAFASYMLGLKVCPWHPVIFTIFFCLILIHVGDLFCFEIGSHVSQVGFELLNFLSLIFQEVALQACTTTSELSFY